MILFTTVVASAGSPKWEKAYETYLEKKWERAIKLFLQISDDSDEYATAQRYIGYNIYGRELGDWEKAVECCISAYLADPKDPKVLKDLGRACLKLQQEIE